MRILCVLGQYNYGNPNRGEGYEYSNFLPTWRRLGHEVIFIDSLNRHTHKNFIDLNKLLFHIVDKEKPDIIFSVLISYEVWLESIDIIRNNCNALLINWATDDSWKYEQFSRFMAPHFHVYATTSSDALFKSKRDGMFNFVLTQWAANAATLAEPLPAQQCRYQVSFVGSSYGNRPKLINALRDRGIDVSCFGHGWENGPVSASEIPRIVRESVISLNFGDSGWVFKGVVPSRSRQIKARVFEVPGLGGFLVTEYAEHLEDFYVPGEEVITFDGINDLADKIRFFLSHPGERDVVAYSGYVRTRDEHTYDARFQALLKAALKMCSPKVTEETKPQSSSHIDFGEFEKLERRHQTSLFLRIIKSVLLVPFVVVWGHRRGRRAARRILFELSWRLFGKNTYSVSSLPGRLFYFES